MRIYWISDKYTKHFDLMDSRYIIDYDYSINELIRCGFRPFLDSIVCKFAFNDEEIELLNSLIESKDRDNLLIAFEIINQRDEK